MVNPLRGFISKERRLFQDIDMESKGILLCEGHGCKAFLNYILKIISGRIEPITIAGDTVLIDRKSAEEFFARNKALFRGLLTDDMSFKEKILRTLSFVTEDKSAHIPGLPLGLFKEQLFGCREGDKAILGMSHQFEAVMDVLKSNNFDVSSVRQYLRGQRSKFLIIDRELFFSHLVEANKERTSQLTSCNGRPELKMLAQFLIDLMQKKKRNEIDG